MLSSVDQLLHYAIEASATNIHLTVGMPPMLRIGGVLRQINVAPLLKNNINSMVLEIMQDVKSINTDGKIISNYIKNYPDRKFSIKINFDNTLDSPNIHIKIITHYIPSLNELELPTSLKNFSELKEGLVVLASNANGGKSTTMASIIDNYSKHDYKNIIILSKFKEFTFNCDKSLISYKVINKDDDLDAERILDVLDKDIDIIFVDDLLCNAIFRQILKVIESGKIVFLTMNASSSTQVLSRIMALLQSQQTCCTEDYNKIIQYLKILIVQKLIPKLNSASIAVAYEVTKFNEHTNILNSSKLNNLGQFISENSNIITMENSINDLIARGIIAENFKLLNGFNNLKSIKDDKNLVLSDDGF